MGPARRRRRPSKTPLKRTPVRKQPSDGIQARPERVGDSSFEALRRRLLEEQPQLTELEQRLLELGGKQVAFLQPESQIDRLLEEGRLFSNEGRRLVEGEPHRCHANAARLWYESRGKVRIATGYWRSGELWGAHSWGMEDGKIVETTWFSDDYFGIVLDEIDSLRSAVADVPGLNERVMRDIAQGTIWPEILQTCAIVAKLHEKRQSPWQRVNRVLKRLSYYLGSHQ